MKLVRPREVRGRTYVGLVKLAELDRHPQLYPVVRSVNQILPRAEVPLGRLHRGVAQQQLNLLKLPASGAT